MSIPFYRGGFALPVAQALRILLSEEVARRALDLMRLTELTFHFTHKTRDSGHSAGGVGGRAGQGERPCVSVHPSLLTQARSKLRDLGHSDGADEICPVEIRLIRGLDGWLFDYITDFNLGPDAERYTETDFNFLDDEYYLQGWGPMQRSEAHMLFEQWQSDFIAHCRLDCFTVIVSGN